MRTLAKLHIIAKRLENLPPLKQADGQGLLEFARRLDVSERTLTGMGPEYVSDLNHLNTLGELNRKLESSGTSVQVGLSSLARDSDSWTFFSF